MAYTESEQALVEALAAEVFADHLAGKLDELTEAFAALEQRLAPRLGAEGRTALRRVSTIYRLSACIEKALPVETCERIFDELARIGFTELKEDAMCRFMLARRCLDAGRDEDGRRAIGDVMDRLQRTIDETGSEELTELRDRMSPLVRSLRG
jgi:hypothetical protein